MKLTHFAALTITLILFAGPGCSKQEDKTTPMPQAADPMQKAMPEPMAKPQAADAQLNNVVQDDSGKTVLYWYDPMVADKHFDKPGKSPFMDMQLVPKYADGTDERSKP
jgi:hypothetical protein